MLTHSEHFIRYTWLFVCTIYFVFSAIVRLDSWSSRFGHGLAYRIFPTAIFLLRIVRQTYLLVILGFHTRLF